MRVRQPSPFFYRKRNSKIFSDLAKFTRLVLEQNQDTGLHVTSCLLLLLYQESSRSSIKYYERPRQMPDAHRVAEKCLFSSAL